jgi:hypothetical protein
MKQLSTLLLCVFFFTNAFAQKETFDLYTFTPPQGWTKNAEDNFVSYIKTNKKLKSWCRINITKSTISKGSIEADFESEWQDLIVKNYHPTGDRQVNEVLEAKGWKIQAGKSKFIFENKEAMAMLTTASGYDRCLSVVAVTNNQDYLKDVQAFIESIDLIKPDTAATHSQNNPQPTDNTEEPAVIGKWLKTSTNNSNYAVNNGLHQYHKMQYEFNANGTYSFLYRSFSYLPDIYFAKENGTYKIDGNTITIIPQASILETWSKGKIKNADGSESEVDKLGKLKTRQNRTLEKVTYQFTSHYFSGINEWQLVLQLDQPTERDGPYNGGTSFANSWLYGTAKYSIKLD